MDFTESEELTLLRQQLRRLLSSFGHAYYAERARSGAKLDALWKRMAESDGSA